MKQEELVLVNADKGKTTVLLSREQYDRKMFDLLRSVNVKRTRFNLKTYNDEVRAAVKTAKHVIASNGAFLYQMSYAKS